MSAIIEQPFITILCNSLQQSAQLTAEPETQENEWDSPSRAIDNDAFPGTRAAQAAFDVLEVCVHALLLLHTSLFHPETRYTL